MGLAPYGKPIYEDKIKKLIDIKDDGTFRLDQDYFNYCYWLNYDNINFIIYLVKNLESQTWKLTQFHMDIAASIQKVTEDIMIKLSNQFERIWYKNLCLAGGVALNCVANGKI